MRQKSILIVEDDPFLSKVLVRIFNDNHFQVYFSDNGDTALDLYSLHTPQAILMDIDIPGKNGWEVLELIRKVDSKTPIFIMTASKLTESDSLKSYDLEASFFIRKPFHPKEILALINNQLKTTYNLSGVVTVNNLQLNLSTFTLKTPTSIHQLIERECKILELLIQNKNQLVKNEDIHSSIWKFYDTRNQEMVKKYISNLRKLTEIEGINIISVRNKGYLLTSSPK
ncbi:response regulator transcription factor [Bacteroidales bacterium OttesenSCG-928-A17]|nr:response regulator transcription factor [Bacteroidales bacterium OttesenSCG-928-A17]